MAATYQNFATCKRRQAVTLHGTDAHLPRNQTLQPDDTDCWASDQWPLWCCAAAGFHKDAPRLTFNLGQCVDHLLPGQIAVPSPWALQASLTTLSPWRGFLGRDLLWGGLSDAERLKNSGPCQLRVLPMTWRECQLSLVSCVMRHRGLHCPLWTCLALAALSNLGILNVNPAKVNRCYVLTGGLERLEAILPWAQVSVCRSLQSYVNPCSPGKLVTVESKLLLAIHAGYSEWSTQPEKRRTQY